jgi:membrane protein
MAFLLRRFRTRQSWPDLMRRTLKEAFWDDNCLGMSAQLAYYFFFALFPALLVLIAIASFFPLATLVDDAIGLLGPFLPPEMLTIITDQLRKLSNGNRGGLLTIGMLAALWSSSTAMTAISDTLNRAYDVEEGRPWWKVRLIAIALTIGVAFFILVATALVLAGPAVASYLADWWYLGSVFEWTWKTLQWPLVFVLVSVGIALVYYFAPDVEQEWPWLAPGAILATTLWLLATLGFKYYVVNMGSYTETYGALGAVMVLMLWFYLSGLVILVGAELNAEIEHASPEGKNPGEKVAGEKRRGGRLLRKWIARRQEHGAGTPSAGEVKEVVDQANGTRDAGNTAAGAAARSSAGKA